jgi:alcohol dehydrogenase class IV
MAPTSRPARSARDPRPARVIEAPSPARDRVGTLESPGTILFGHGALDEVGKQAAGLRARSVLLVTDSFLVDSGRVDDVVAHLEDAHLEVSVFSGVEPDPTDEAVLAGLAQLRSSDADVIVALGGGSAIDAAKMISALSANPEPVSRYMGYGLLAAPGVPLVAVPTTAGTGSEATRVAVITEVAAQEKMMILDSKLLPAVAIVDPSLSSSMPAALTANVGVDTLCHGIEAFVSRLAHPLSDAHALLCVRLVGEHLERAWAEPGNADARAGMALAALAGGMAFSNASVGLVHGMSRPLGALFHLPHGLSNAVLLPAVTRFSLPGNAGRYADIARELHLVDVRDTDDIAGEALVSYLQDLNGRLGIGRIAELPGVSRERFEASLDQMAVAALASGSPDRNPVIPTAQEIIALYQESF